MLIPDEPQFAAMQMPNDQDVAAATAQLFGDIANSSAIPEIADAMLALNQQLAPIRAYETAFIPDLEAEYAQLSACWKRRDFVQLQMLIGTYFRRRRAIIPKIVALLSAPN